MDAPIAGLRLAGYEHLLRAAERGAWDESMLDLRPDAAAFATWPADVRRDLRSLIAGLCVAEAAVAAELAPFGPAAQEPLLAECFARQASDEARHARFFARVANEVAGPGVVRPEVRVLFERELPARAAALAAGGGLAPAVGLYHLVLEGVAFLAGQHALVSLLDEVGWHGDLRLGVESVAVDERWHLGLGVRCLADLEVDAVNLEEPLELALSCWGPSVTRRVDLDALRRGHARRLGFTGSAPGS